MNHRAILTTPSLVPSLVFALVFPLSAALAGCTQPPPEPTPTKDPAARAVADLGQKAGDAPAGSAAPAATPTPAPPPPAKKKVAAVPVATVPVSADDPVKGQWTLADATKGLPPGKDLVATIDTDLGTMKCKLYDDKAPITVANFVGLARGNRPWKTPEGKWDKKPAYDGTTFHRIIKGFMIQGGDTQHLNGAGEAGYVIPDEIWEDANHDRPGLLCMANRGKNTNSAQFFITDKAAPWLDNGYTIFGECTPEEVVHKIADVPVKGEKAEKVPVIKSISVQRR